MHLTDKFENRMRLYKEAFAHYGYSEKSLEMPSDRRNIRYYELIKNFSFYGNNETQEEFTLLDAGCGFGDINAYFDLVGLKKYRYIGLDVIDEFLKVAEERYLGEGIFFIKRNFISEEIDDLSYDYAISSQTFNDPYIDAEDNNYEILFSAMKKLYLHCKKGISFNFVTDKGDCKKKDVAYHDPVKILEFAYTLSNNVILDNSCMPFEATCTIVKDAMILRGKLFKSFQKRHIEEFRNGCFVVKE